MYLKNKSKKGSRSKRRSFAADERSLSNSDQSTFAFWYGVKPEIVSVNLKRETPVSVIRYLLSDVSENPETRPAHPTPWRFFSFPFSMGWMLPIKRFFVLSTSLSMTR